MSYIDTMRRLGRVPLLSNPATRALERAFKRAYLVAVKTSVRLTGRSVRFTAGRIHIDPRDSIIADAIVLYRVYERVHTALIRELAPEGGVMVDVGANIGVHTLVGADAVGPDGQVIAFEPDPHNHTLLRRNVDTNHLDQVRCVQSAVSDTAGTLTLWRSRGNLGAHSLAASNVLDARREPVEVSTVVLDDVLEATLGDRTVDLVKVDVQGAEAMVVRSMRRTLERARPIVMLEYYDHAIRNLHGDPEEIIETFRALDYAFYEMCREPDGIRALDAATVATAHAGEELNLLLVPSDRPMERLERYRLDRSRR